MRIGRAAALLPGAGGTPAGGGDDRLHELPCARRQPQRRRQRLPAELRAGSRRARPTGAAASRTARSGPTGWPDAFRDDGLPTGNHAWGGSNVAGGGIDVPDLVDAGGRATARSTTTGVGDRPLVAIWSGGNDVLDIAGSSGVRRRRRATSAERLGDVATGLAPRGTRDFLILNLPDIGAIPKFARRPRRRPLRDPRHQGVQPRARRPDRGAARRRRPRAEGERLRRSSRTCWSTRGATACATPRRPASTRTTMPAAGGRDGAAAFFDEIHPNRVVHQRIAEAAMAQDRRRRGATAASPAATAGAGAAAGVGGALLAGRAARGLAGLGARYQRRSRGPSERAEPGDAEDRRGRTRWHRRAGSSRCSAARRSPPTTDPASSPASAPLRRGRIEAPRPSAQSAPPSKGTRDQAHRARGKSPRCRPSPPGPNRPPAPARIRGRRRRRASASAASMSQRPAPAAGPAAPAERRRAPAPIPSSSGKPCRSSTSGGVMHRPEIHPEDRQRDGADPGGDRHHGQRPAPARAAAVAPRRRRSPGSGPRSSFDHPRAEAGELLHRAMQRHPHRRLGHRRARPRSRRRWRRRGRSRARSRPTAGRAGRSPAPCRCARSGRRPRAPAASSAKSSTGTCTRRPRARKASTTL